MEKVLQFLRKRKLLAIAPHGTEGAWIANVYFGTDEQGTIYFISPEDNKHSKMILQNPKIAFSVAWFDENNHKNRKAVQGLGICRPAKTEDEIATGVRLHNESFPELKDRITVDWIHTNEWNSKVWVLQPNYIKYWDDELYGHDETEEFDLPQK